MPISKTTKQVTATKEPEEKNDETVIQEESGQKKESDLEKKAPVRKTAAKRTTKTTVKNIRTNP